MSSRSQPGTLAHTSAIPKPADTASATSFAQPRWCNGLARGRRGPGAGPALLAIALGQATARSARTRGAPRGRQPPTEASSVRWQAGADIAQQNWDTVVHPLVVRAWAEGRSRPGDI